jgi:hypothetical protein
VQTRIIRAKVADLVLLDLNARYMRHETFQRLVANVREDGDLTSVPFGAPAGTVNALTGEKPEHIGKWEVLSGNHRVMSAKEVGLEEIDLKVTDDDLPRKRRIAIQLSHNAIEGEDDPATLRQLYEMIDDVDLRAYSGLDDKVLDLMPSVDIESLSEAALDWSTVTVVFLPDDVVRAKAALDEARTTASADATWLARFGEYDRFLDALAQASSAHDVKNTATAFLLLLSIYERHRTDLAEGWYLDDANVRHNGRVPLASIFGRDEIPSKVAAPIKRAVDVLISRKKLDASEPWRILTAWAEQELQSQSVARSERQVDHDADDWTDLADVVGSGRIPESAATIVRRALDAMTRLGETTPKNRWQGLEYMAAEYLSGVEVEA